MVTGGTHLPALLKVWLKQFAELLDGVLVSRGSGGIVESAQNGIGGGEEKVLCV